MGAYLSTPNRDKQSEDGSNDFIRYGASSMQGWRISQEDSHNCCLDFDEKKNTFLFAVYDGHGGAEVAQYTSANLPNYIKSMPLYTEGKVAEALEKAFLEFDELLTKEDVVQELKLLAGAPTDEEEAEGQTKEEQEALFEEATMPIEELMKRYQSGSHPDLKQKAEVQSPAIRARKDNDSENKLQEQSGKDVTKTEAVNGHIFGENNESELCEEKKTEVEVENKTSVSEMLKEEQKGNEMAAEEKKSVVMNEKKVSDGETIKEGNSEKPAASSTAQISVEEPGGSSVSAGSTSEASGSSKKPANGSVKVGKNDKLTEQMDAEPCSSSGKVSQGSPCDDETSEEDEDSDDSEDVWESSEGDDEEEDEEDEEGDDGEMFSRWNDDDDDDDDDEDENEDDIMCGGEEPGVDSGCTAVVSLLVGDQLYVANAGDSRCVLCRGGKAVDMSIDHKPEDELEHERIRKAGGRVTRDGRVNGGLNLSRAIGDHCYKKNPDLDPREKMITALPDVKSMTLGEEDEFMVLACDGVWNSMTSQDVVNFVSTRLKAGVTNLSSICEEMFEFCLAPDTMGDGTGCDNMTCIIVTFDNLNKLSENGSAKRKASKDESDDVSDSKRIKMDTTCSDDKNEK